jgi:hypothetical protein
LTGEERPDHNVGVHMTRSAFGIVVPQCMLAGIGGAHLETIA